MSLRKVFQIRRGTVSLGILKAEEDGKIMLSLDKDFVSRRVKGPLFSETELSDVAELISEYEEWESRAVRTKQPDADSPQDSYRRMLTNLEIDRAIELAREADVQPQLKKGEVRITVLPTMPEYRYLHTCPKCGCHVASHLRLPGGSCLKLCPNCETAYGQSTPRW